MSDELVWMQELYYVCPWCGAKIPDGELHLSRIEGDNKNFARCPECLGESVLLQEYW